MQKVTTFLMFPQRAEEAVNLYVSLFDNARITGIQRFESEPAQGAAMITFEIDGQEFYAMDGGPHFKFEEGMSLMVDCKSQAEVDKLYDTLSEGGEKQPCGWVKDKFGVSWQIVPEAMMAMMRGENPERARRAMEAMMRMVKLDIAELKRAWEGSAGDQPSGETAAD